MHTAEDVIRANYLYRPVICMKLWLYMYSYLTHNVNAITSYSWILLHGNAFDIQQLN